MIRNIRESLNRFLSIAFIVALGSGFMAGLAAASPDMYDSADSYIRQYRLFDLDIRSTVGFTEEDLASLRTEDQIGGVLGGRVFDMVLHDAGGSDFTSRVYGFLDENGESDMNCLQLTEGRLPRAPGECVAESVFGRYTGEEIHVGDVLTLEGDSSGDVTLQDIMTDTSLTVVGLCRSPMCISVEGDPSSTGSGTINLNVYVQQDFFTCDYYTDAYLLIKDADQMNTFGDAYTEYIDSVIEDLKPLGTKLVSDRIGILTEDAEAQIKELELLVEELEGVSIVKEELDSDLSIRLEMNAITKDALPSLSGLLQQTQQLFTDSSDSNQMQNASSLLLEEKLEDARTQMEQLRQGSWIYRTRNDLAGFDSYSNNVGKVSALAKIFPVFFFIVALLVALTTMTRLIEERRLQIGTLKALGYSNGQILSEYLLFSLSASVLGCILGFAVGFRIFPLAINAAYSMMYFLPSMTAPIRWEIVSWVAPVTICSILLAALWSCWNEFRSVPAALMVPRSPAPGKRIWLEHIGFIWRKLPFTYKVTFRNLFRYKKRFIMTMIGVAGCSALLLTGFGIRDSVNDIVDKQFGELYQYDLMYVLDKEDSLREDTELSNILNDRQLISSFLLSAQETGKIYFGKDRQELTIFVPEDPDLFPTFTVLRDRKSHEEFPLADGSVILTEKMCEEMKIRAGDTVLLEDSDGHQMQVIVSAIAENYVSSFAYMTRECYEELFQHAPDFTTLLCISEQDVSSKILSDPHVLFGRSVSSLKESFSDSIRSINGVIAVLILAAGLLCIVVLYNLINVNICERRKELATLRVLGFYKKETRSYIFRETNILSFLGSLAGLLIGIWLHGFVVRTVEVNHIMFGREIKPLSYVIALAISVVFTLIVNVIMRKAVNSTDMVEAMKAND